jgi:hypothetical protein
MRWRLRMKICPKYILEWIKWLNVPIMDVIMGGMLSVKKLPTNYESQTYGIVSSVKLWNIVVMMVVVETLFYGFYNHLW